MQMISKFGMHKSKNEKKTRSTDAELAGLGLNAAIIVVPCSVKTGKNLFLPGRFKPRFKPLLAETCQPWFS